MDDQQDPVADAAEGGADLYDIATWEERTSLDGVAVALYRLLSVLSRVGVVLVGAVLLLGVVGLGTLTNPEVGLLTVLSAAPALGLAGYVWYADEVTDEPPALLVGTFLLGVVTANFAAVLNGIAGPQFRRLAGGVGTVVFFFLVVGPVEESVKLLAVRLWAYTKSGFDAVIDGAVYGAMAGLGFATIENALYISRQLPESQAIGLGLIGAGGGITALRALAGPGHVIYSAFAGYYLGLAKFNPGSRGPIVVKGIVIAALIHATYNSVVGPASVLLAGVLGTGGFLSYLLFVALYDGVFGLLLVRKLKRYRDAYHSARDDGRVESAREGDVPDVE